MTSAKKGALAPAKGMLSWYDGSVKPGSKGTAVILGHMSDTLASLGSIRNGATITVGGTAYRVTEVKRNQKSAALSSDADLWGADTSTTRLAVVGLNGDKSIVVLAEAA